MVNNEIQLRRIHSLSPERTLELILEALHELVDYELAVALSLDDENHLQVRKAVGPLYTPKLEGFSISLEKRQDIAGILEKRIPHLFDEAQHLDTYYEVLDLPNDHSCLVSPLFVEDTPVGLLTLDHRACGKFTPNVVSFIATISKLVSVALVQSDASQALLAKTQNLLQERNRLLGENTDAFRDLVGVSPAWSGILDSILLVSISDAPVLVLGETGTGKEQVARTLHRLSRRAEGPFIPVNCSALAPSLAESELFGHEKGSFSGATGLRKGRFELANGGTLFLDEIGDLPLDLQPKLLRILQDGVFERVGGEKSITVDVRIIAATNVDLLQALAQGKFREDLLYRLDVFPIRLPPLRERGEDAVLLAEHFVRLIKKRAGFEQLVLSKSAIDAILGHHWPGNARELRNAIERAAILARGGLISENHIVVSESKNVLAQNASILQKKDRESFLPFDEMQKQYIQQALEICGGKVYGQQGAAKLLGIKPTTLQSRMKKLGF